MTRLTSVALPNYYVPHPGVERLRGREHPNHEGCATSEEHGFDWSKTSETGEPPASEPSMLRMEGEIERWKKNKNDIKTT